MTDIKWRDCPVIIPYYCGKYQLSKILIPMLPKHQRYIEVFAGGLSMYMRKANAEFSIVNDFDNDVANLYHVICEDFDAFKKYCRMIPKSRHLFYNFRLELNEKHDIKFPDYKRAAKYFYIIMNGFNHNYQTLRVLTHIEKRHPDFRGLNLTWESLEGIVKHNGIVVSNIPFHTNIYNNKHDLLLSNQPFMESQIAAISDDVAYNNHDVEDAIRAGLLSIDLLQEIIFFNNIINQLKKEYTIIDDKLLMFQVLRKSMSLMIEDIYNQTKKNILDLDIKTKEDLQNYNNFIVTFSPSMQSKAKNIKSFLFDNVYNHQNLLDKRQNVEKIISDLFKYFYNSPNKLPEDWRSINEPIERVICDYISGMTDRYASRLHKDLYE